MVKFYAGKILRYTLVIWVAITLNFLLPRLMPGNPIRYMVGEDFIYMTQEEKDILMERTGLNDPILEQYGNYFQDLFQGDLGYSYGSGKPVSTLIGEKLPWTLLLSVTNLILTTLLGVWLGTLAAWRRNSKLDRNLTSLMAVLKSMPTFWVAMVLVAIFAVGLRWFPVYGGQVPYGSMSWLDKVGDIAYHLVLPALTLVLVSVSTIFFTMRVSLVEVLGEDYMVMAKLKGLPEKTIKYRHGMANALVPVFTVVMMHMGYMLGGATVVETVFAYPGMGRLLYDAVLALDYPLIQGCFLVITLCVIFANLVADILYPLLDPKVV